jgi:hypothetical protein
LAEYLAVENETGFTMFNGESLADRILDDQDDEPEPDSPHQGELF